MTLFAVIGPEAQRWLDWAYQFINEIDGPLTLYIIWQLASARKRGERIEAAAGAAAMEANRTRTAAQLAAELAKQERGELMHIVREARDLSKHTDDKVSEGRRGNNGDTG